MGGDFFFCKSKRKWRTLSVCLSSKTLSGRERMERGLKIFPLKRVCVCVWVDVWVIEQEREREKYPRIGSEDRVGHRYC